MAGMCCFSGRSAAVEVANTRIYARRRGDRQLLVYDMRVRASEPVAMVLPLHVVPGSGADALRFVDLSGMPGLFDDLERTFAPQTLARGPAPRPAAPLKVERVGAFEASYVPTLADFGRLDPRFRVDEALWRRLPGYAAAGFAVFKLRAGEQRVHPMAFEYAARWPTWLFFPTVHIHDGTLAEQADFDHSLYFQGYDFAVIDGEFFSVDRRLGDARGVAGECSGALVGTAVRGPLAAQLFELKRPIFRLRARERLSNDDMWVAPADDDALTGCAGYGVSAWTPRPG